MSNYNNYDDIQDRHMDTMIRLAYLQKEALETEDILKEVEESTRKMNRCILTLPIKCF